MGSRQIEPTDQRAHLLGDLDWRDVPESERRMAISDGGQGAVGMGSRQDLGYRKRGQIPESQKSSLVLPSLPLPPLPLPSCLSFPFFF